jgi:hypothetical protein
MAPPSRGNAQLVNDDVTVALRILAWGGGVSALIWLGTVMVKAAKRGGGGMRGIGAALMMFGWATMRDPRNDTVAEAQDGRIRKGTHSGDPLDRDSSS